MLVNDLISIYIPSTLPLLLIAHLFALISPGPDFIIVTGHALRGRFRGAVFICVGICLANALYISIAMLGWSVLTQQANLLMTMQFIGSIYLIYIGYSLIRSQVTHLDNIHSAITISPPQQLFTGFTSAILNPKNMLFYFSLTGLLLGGDVTTIQKISTSLCMVMMVLFYNLLLVKLITLPRFINALQGRLHYFERLAGLILIFIALLVLYSELSIIIQ